MSQCVPSWDLDDNSTPARGSLRAHFNTTAPDDPMFDYEVAELTWENGQLTLHGLGLPRVPAKPLTFSKYTWEKPRASGTLESIVNQATRLPNHKPHFHGSGNGGDELAPWFDHQRVAAAVVPAAAGADATASATMAMDALVPCSNRYEDRTTATRNVIDSVVGCSTRVGSCSGPVAAGTRQDEDEGKRASEAAAAAVAVRVPVTPEWSRDLSVSGSATFGRDSHHVTVDTYERDFGVGFTSTSTGSPENTKATTSADDHDSVCHSRPQRETDDEEGKKKGTRKSSVSTKRSRAAAIHNQSERKRRDKINQRMKILQKLVPNSSKTDKASMLDEVIEYLKQLQAQVHMMSRMNMSPMMFPLAMQQLQMSMMAPMSMGMGMGMGMGLGMGMGVMDINTMGRPNIAGISPVLPNPFMPMTSWDGSGDRMQAATATIMPAPATIMPDPLSAFIACQSQPMTMDAYSRMAVMYQQLQQPPAPSSKS